MGSARARAYPGAMSLPRASKTAEIAAAVRAAHLSYDRPVVFADPLALQLTSPGWRAVVRRPWLHRLIVRGLLADFRGIHAEMLGRARFAEEALERAVEAGVSQYVIVGAGLDSFALRRRDLAQRLRVFELDQLGSQAVKRTRLAALGAGALSHVEFVAADFERESVAEALARSGFDPRAPAFFSWLGGTYYLGRGAIDMTLRVIARFAAPGSELVADYALPPEAQPPGELRAFRRAQAAVARRGEPWQAFFEPAEFAALARDCGFQVLANVGPDEQLDRYFADRDDDLRPAGWGYFAHLRVKTV